MLSHCSWKVVNYFSNLVVNSKKFNYFYSKVINYVVVGLFRAHYCSYYYYYYHYRGEEAELSKDLVSTAQCAAVIDSWWVQQWMWRNIRLHQPSSLYWHVERYFQHSTFNTPSPQYTLTHPLQHTITTVYTHPPIATVYNPYFHQTPQEAQLLLGDRATRKHAKDSWNGRGNDNLGWMTFKCT